MSKQQSADMDVDLVARRAVSRTRPVADGHLPLTEATFDRAGAPSPFGDDLQFPLPVSNLTYVHPSPDAFPQHL
jgi:hypothetical protein